jgi:hypothetical protein
MLDPGSGSRSKNCTFILKKTDLKICKNALFDIFFLMYRKKGFGK